MAKYILHHFLRIATDFEPETFGRLTTIGPIFMLPVGNQGRSCTFQVCKCSCSKQATVISRVDDLRNGRILSCGCVKSERTKEAATVHGKSNTSEFYTWLSIDQRCNNPKLRQYADYGGRGIKMCDRWSSRKHPKGMAFVHFFEDMGPKPSPEHSIDRIDVNGDYCPENCRWATYTEQANNRTNNHILEYKGQSKTVSMWATELGVDASLLYSRLSAGWTIRQAIEVPSNKNLKRDSFVYQGEMITWEELASRHNMRADTLRYRVKNGWSLENALTIPVGYKRSKPKDPLERKSDAHQEPPQPLL